MDDWGDEWGDTYDSYALEEDISEIGIDDFESEPCDSDIGSTFRVADDKYSDDLFDRAIDFPDFESHIDAKTLGLSLALSEELHDLERKSYDIDKNTDAENMVRATQLTSLASRNNKTRLRPFEQYIDDVCKGRRSLFGE